MPQPTHQPDWQKIFLEAGTYETGTDLSIMISTVSKILSQERSKWQAQGRDQIEKQIQVAQKYDETSGLTFVLSLPFLKEDK